MVDVLEELTWEQIAELAAAEDDTPTEELARRVVAASDIYETRIDHEFVVRQTLLRIFALKRQQERLKALKGRLVEQYDEKIQMATIAENRLRESVYAFLVQHNDGKAISFPDVGGAHLTTKNKGGKTRVADLVALQSFITESLPEVREEVTFTEEMWDTEKAHALLLERLGLKATADGKLVNPETGEAAEPEALGLEVLPEEKVIAVKGAS